MSFKKAVLAVVVGHFTYSFASGVINGVINNVGERNHWDYRVQLWTEAKSEQFHNWLDTKHPLPDKADWDPKWGAYPGESSQQWRREPAFDEEP